MYRPTLAIDFDGVIHNRPKEEQGNTEITGLPVNGALKFLTAATQMFDVVIYSARFTGEGSTEAVKVVSDFLRYHLYDYTGDDEVFEKIKLSATKPMAKVYLDDRAVCFDGEFPSIDKLLKFRTWQGR